MIEEPKIEELTGLSYYDHLPEGFVRATAADLKNGYFKHKAPYLLQSFHNGIYYPRRVNIALNKADLPWLQAGRMWIYKTMIFILSTMILVCSCQKEPDPVICFDCTYHDEIYNFCQTQREMDSICRIFNTGCENDSMICKKLKP